MRLGLPILAAVFLSACASQPPIGSPIVSRADLMAVAGDGWKGELIYRDYSPPFGEVKLAVEAIVTARQDGLSLALHYPKEPGADGESVLTLSADGTMLDGEFVVAREQSGDRLTITTQARCEDDNLTATCRHVYTISPKAFGWTKLVALDRDGKEFQRNAYTFTR